MQLAVHFTGYAIAGS